MDWRDNTEPNRHSWRRTKSYQEDRRVDTQFYNTVPRFIIGVRIGCDGNLQDRSARRNQRRLPDRGGI